MAVLSDRDLRRRLNYIPKEARDNENGDHDYRIGIEPLEDRQIQPASVDLTLDKGFMVYPYDRYDPTFGDEPIDMADAKNVETELLDEDTHYLQPHELVLCSTAEYVEIPADIQAQVHGKSSLGRLGLLVHVTAGFIDPGFHGKITLEMYNLNNVPIILRSGLSICQLSFTRLSSTAEFPYGHEKLRSKYQDQRAITASRYAG
jgi:dCTP deaminase